VPPHAAPASAPFAEPPAPAAPARDDAVPDDVYDAYDEVLDDQPAPAPEARAVAALGGAGRQSVSPAPAAAPAHAAPWEEPAAPQAPAAPARPPAPSAPSAAPGAPASPEDIADQACAGLSRLLTEGFGAFVPVSVDG
jgi:hypothetical protein